MLFLRISTMFLMFVSSLGYSEYQPEPEPEVVVENGAVVDQLNESDQEIVFNDLVRFIGYEDALVVFELGQLEEFAAVNGEDSLTIPQIFRRSMLRVQCNLIHAIKSGEFRDLQEYWDAQ